MLSFTLYFYNKNIFSYEKKKTGTYLSLKLGFCGPTLESKEAEDDFKDSYYKFKLNIPVYADYYKSDIHCSFALAAILGIRVSVQWGY